MRAELGHGGAARHEADRPFCHSLRLVPLGPPAAGLCASCVHARIVESSRGSTFVLCGLSVEDLRFPRYPTLPVLRCAGYQPPAAKTPDTGA